MSHAAELAHGVIVGGISGTVAHSDLPRFGGYLLFPSDGATAAEVRALTDELRARGGDPAPLIAIDQEGGAVMRLREGVEPMPAMMALGAADDVELTQRAGEQVAFDLRRAGCTLDFAPVLDLALDPSNTVIGTRAFGAGPELVARHGAQFAHGMRRGGIIPCYKHFPGHGATAVDSHHALPVVEADAATLRARDLVPFERLAAQASAVMSAHEVVPAFDAEYPATLSRRIAHDLLRGELGFRGVFVTDCLEMGAIASRPDVAVEALAAGADLLLYSHDHERASAAAVAIERAVESGRLAAERLEDAYARVMRLRLAASEPISLETFPPHPDVGREIGRRGIALVRGVAHADPSASLAIAFGGSSEALRREAPSLESFDASLDPSVDETVELCARIAASRRRPLLLARRAHLHAAQVQAIVEILNRYPDACVVSLLEPFDLPLFARARHLLATHGDSVASIRGLSDVLFGGSLPTANLAVSF
ncbi:MAG TPA: glycoside hydrolase family 3 N-terminal domain-containing protein [Candidatus Nitrosotalea sp.]|nr:glycoside hydrolase family 3 N-terminal domain-containing protein [Candidatus Nitrosotalea sp.]